MQACTDCQVLGEAGDLYRQGRRTDHAPFNDGCGHRSRSRRDQSQLSRQRRWNRHGRYIQKYTLLSKTDLTVVKGHAANWFVSNIEKYMPARKKR
jgi:hypothetical protein